ncbi:hypothetical protein DFP72DRAFT_936576 [Ephemerocybe angulata]|uniref:Uncharacterized protein n=1 Tax=Ephemerocybe angulata TaxID=980116 RepID=A0A8H6LUL6_9AGAR|nr:hypothetical protein DFP72DRAFT_936576 [Tulosesus angulatus]
MPAHGSNSLYQAVEFHNLATARDEKQTRPNAPRLRACTTRTRWKSMLDGWQGVHEGSFTKGHWHAANRRPDVKRRADPTCLQHTPGGEGEGHFGRRGLCDAGLESSKSTTRHVFLIDRTTPNTSGIVELQALSDVRAQRHPTRTDRYDADNVNPHATTTTTCAPKSPVHSSPGGHTTSSLGTHSIEHNGDVVYTINAEPNDDADERPSTALNTRGRRRRLTVYPTSTPLPFPDLPERLSPRRRERRQTPIRYQSLSVLCWDRRRRQREGGAREVFVRNAVTSSTTTTTTAGRHRERRRRRRTRLDLYDSQYLASGTPANTRSSKPRRLTTTNDDEHPSGTLPSPGHPARCRRRRGRKLVEEREGVMR